MKDFAYGSRTYDQESVPCFLTPCGLLAFWWEEKKRRRQGIEIWESNLIGFVVGGAESRTQQCWVESIIVLLLKQLFASLLI